MNFRFYGATILLAICSLGLVGFGVWPAQPISKIGSDGFVAPIVNVSSNCECAGHPAGCGCCQPACETRTILVPCWETRYALANQTRFRTEMRTRDYTIYEPRYRKVPEVKHYTVMVPETRTREFVTYRQQPYQHEIQEPYTVMLPVTRQREKTEYRTEPYSEQYEETYTCLLYTSPSPRDKRQSRMPSSA